MCLFSLTVSSRAYFILMMIVDIQCPETAIVGVYNCLNTRRGQVFSEEQRPGTPLFTIKAYLPVSESFGFNGELRQHTAGQAFPQSVLDHWEVMNGCEWFFFVLDRSFINIQSSAPLDKGSKIEELVTKIRVRKGLKVGILFLHLCFDLTVRDPTFVSPRFRLSTCTTTNSKTRQATYIY